MVYTDVGGGATSVNAGEIGRTWVSGADTASVEIELLELYVCHHHRREPANSATIIIVVVLVVRGVR